MIPQAITAKQIRILILEDNISDAELLKRELRKSDLNFISELATDKRSYTQTLDKFFPDIILADYSVPGFDGLSALNMARERNKFIPVIVVSGVIGEDFAIETLKAGATDYVLKSGLAKVVPAVKRAVWETQQLAEEDRAKNKIREQSEKLGRLYDEERQLTAQLESERKRLNKALEQAQFFANIVENSAQPFAAGTPDGRIIAINNAYAEMTGYSREELESASWKTDLTPPEWREKNMQVFNEALTTGKSQRFEKEYLRKDGSRLPIELFLNVVKENGNPLYYYSFFTDLTERKERERLSNALNDINAIVSSTLDPDRIMRRVISEAVKAIGAESSAINMPEDGSLAVKYIYGLPEQVLSLKFTAQEVPHMQTALRTRQPVIINDAEADKQLNQSLVTTFNIKSFMIVPIIMKDEAVGLIFFFYHSQKIAFTDNQKDFSAKLAASVALALENARLFEAERNIADTLQDALMTIPDQIDHLEYGHLYRSATETARVGGDFYDLFELEHDKIGIVIGDVSGKGLQAATLTAIVKNTVRAYALDGSGVSKVMAKTNNVVYAATGSDNFITLIFAILDRQTGLLTFCNAGHPPGILKKAEEVCILEAYSPIIGAFTDLTYTEHEKALDKDDLLVLYTDGLIEARNTGGDIYEEEKLVTFLEALGPLSPKELPQAIFNEVSKFTGGSLSDDLAIMAVSVK